MFPFSDSSRDFLASEDLLKDSLVVIRQSSFVRSRPHHRSLRDWLMDLHSPRRSER